MKNRVGKNFFNRLIDILKTLLLIGLIISSVYFAVLIFDSQYAINGGENVSVIDQIKTLPGRLFGGEKESEDLDSQSSAFFSSIAPSYVVVNDEGNRGVYFENTEEYDRIYPLLNGIMLSLYSSAPLSVEVLEDFSQWTAVLDGKSVYLRYNTVLSPKLAARFANAGAEHITQNVSVYDEVIIIPYSEDYLGEATVYIKDNGGGRVVKFNVSANADLLANTISLMPKSNGEYIFGVELESEINNIDLGQLGGNVRFDTTALMPVATVRTTPIKMYSYIANETASSPLNSPIISGILQSFKYNTNFVRQYVERDNTSVFVDDYSTLKVDQTGVIEYRPVDTAHGINLFSDKRLSKTEQLYAGVNKTIDLIQNIQRAAEIDSGEIKCSLKLTSSLDVERVEAEQIITLDYVYEGRDVELNGTHAALAIIKDGVLTYFKFYLTGFTAEKEDAPNETVFAAIQRYMNQINDTNNEMYIKDVRLYYILNPVVGSAHTSWKIR